MTSRNRIFPRVQRSLCALLRWVVCGSALVWACGPKLLYLPRADAEGAVWRQPGGHARGTALLLHGPKPPLQVAWQQHLGGMPLGGPLLDGSLVLLANEISLLRACHIGGGMILGKVTLPEKICVPPTIAGTRGEVLVLATAADKPTLVALDRRTRKTIWRRKMAVCAPVTSRHDTLIVPDESGQLLALGAADGAELWLWQGEVRMVVQAAVGGDTVYGGDVDGLVTALDLRTGALRWQRALGEGIRSGPCVDGGQVVVGTSAGTVVALRAESGEVVWERHLGGLLAPGLAMGPRVVVAGSSDHYLYGLDRVSGEVVWRFETDGVVGGSPACTPVTAFAASADGFAYALEVDTGVLQWRYQLDGPVMNAVALGDGSLSVATDQGSLYLFVEEMSGVGVR